MRLSPLRHSHSLSFTKFQGEALAAELELGAPYPYLSPGTAPWVMLCGRAVR
jgi:hypothetical protein